MFKYGDKVKVIKGFYEGCNGIVLDYNAHRQRYKIEIFKMTNYCTLRKIIILPKDYIL